MNIRDILLSIFAIAWLFVVLLTAWRFSAVPAELWGMLGVGLGGILAAFRVDAKFTDQRSGEGK